MAIGASSCDPSEIDRTSTGTASASPPALSTPADSNGNGSADPELVDERRALERIRRAQAAHVAAAVAHATRLADEAAVIQVILRGSPIMAKTWIDATLADG